MNKKGYLYYEVLICLVLIMTLIYLLIGPLNQLLISYKNHQLNYEMKQTLYLNVVLYENHEPLKEDETYQLFILQDQICIEWWDLNNEHRTSCEKIWI